MVNQPIESDIIPAEYLLDPERYTLPIEGTSISFSQVGQDKIVEAIFFSMDKTNKSPSYLDVGANHPISCSNSALFYRNGATGYAVEANPNFREIWHKFRPRDTFINAAVVPSGGCKVTLNIIDDYSQLNYIGDRSGTAQKYGKEKTHEIEVSAYSLNQIIDMYCTVCSLTICHLTLKVMIWMCSKRQTFLKHIQRLSLLKIEVMN
jgi:hypothetical protein